MNSNGEPVNLSDETAQIVRFALDMAEETDGALEPTIYPVLTAWGFTTDENRIPAEEEIQALLENVGYDKVELNGNAIRLQPGMELDMGAVGKGYAGDLAAELLDPDRTAPTGGWGSGILSEKVRLEYFRYLTVLW